MEKNPNSSSHLQRLPPPEEIAASSSSSLGQSMAGYSWRDLAVSRLGSAECPGGRVSQFVPLRRGQKEQNTCLSCGDLRPLHLKTKENVSFPLAKATLAPFMSPGLALGRRWRLWARDGRRPGSCRTTSAPQSAGRSPGSHQSSCSLLSL